MLVAPFCRHSHQNLAPIEVLTATTKRRATCQRDSLKSFAANFCFFWVERKRQKIQTEGYSSLSVGRITSPAKSTSSFFARESRQAGPLPDAAHCVCFNACPQTTKHEKNPTNTTKLFIIISCWCGFWLICDREFYFFFCLFFDLVLDLLKLFFFRLLTWFSPIKIAFDLVLGYWFIWFYMTISDSFSTYGCWHGFWMFGSFVY